MHLRCLVTHSLCGITYNTLHSRLEICLQNRSCKVARIKCSSALSMLCTCNNDKHIHVAMLHKNLNGNMWVGAIAARQACTCAIVPIAFVRDSLCPAPCEQLLHDCALPLPRVTYDPTCMSISTPMCN